MNYDDMPAGREMDALVADKVIGLVLSYKEDGMQRYDTRTEGDTEMWMENVKEYSTSISAAWEVVEKMSAEYSLAIYHTVPVSSVMRGWNIGLSKSVYPPERRDEAIWGWAEDLPLAICRAALNAVGKEG